MASANYSDFDLGWLVGWLEAEGYFGLTGPNNMSGRRYFRVTGTTTDLDTAERFAKMVGAKVHVQKYTNGNKDCYRVYLTGSSAIKLALSLLPRLSARKQRQIADALRASEQFNEMFQRVEIVTNGKASAPSPPQDSERADHSRVQG